MKIPTSKLFFILIASSVILNSCYNRLTGNYDEFPDLTDSSSAILDQTGLSKEEQARRREILQDMNKAQQDAYRINAGDVLQVVVYDHPDLRTSSVVTPDGFIGMVFVNQLHVAGKTIKEATELIQDALKDYIVNPAVGVIPSEIHSETVSIVGACARPGMYTISQGMRLADLYALVGGSSVRNYDNQWLDAADLTNSLFIRDGKIVDAVDFHLAIEHGDPDHNLLLRKGDYVYIGVRSESMVCLIGDIPNPHKRVWDNNLGLLEVLTTGGYLKETYWPHAIIIRGGVANPTLYKVDIDGILQGRRPNVMLEAGDVIYIPKDNISEFNVFVRKIMPSVQLFNIIRGNVRK